MPHVYVDGGVTGYRICLYDPQENKYYIKSRGKHTNNELEYLAVIYALEHIKRKKYKKAIIYSDSKLVVNQLLGNYKVNKDNLYYFYKNASQKLLKLCGTKLVWIKRDKNRAGIHLETLKTRERRKRTSLDK